MALLVLPRHFSSRAELYQQFSRLTAAGIGIPQAVEIQRRSPPASSFRAPLGIIQQRLAEGATFAEALHSTGNWLPSFDSALLHAGEQSGRLPSCFELLATHYERNAALLRKTLTSLFYPALLFHMAVLIAPLPDLVKTWNLFAYLAKVLLVFVPVYALVAFVVVALQGQHGERWRALIESVLHRVPLLGKARRNLALARLASALEALTAAGVNIIEGWELAATASGSPAIGNAVASWRPQLLAGATPSELLRSSAIFPELFANLYHTGEITGSLDDTLRRLYRLYQDDGERQLQLVADWTPKLVYFGVVILVAWQVIQFWSGYFNQINQVIGE
jgi:type II secretory pathway component PulF